MLTPAGCGEAWVRADLEVEDLPVERPLGERGAERRRPGARPGARGLSKNALSRAVTMTGRAGKPGRRSCGPGAHGSAGPR